MNSFVYLLKILAAWLAVITGISANIEDIYALHKKGTNTWQRYGAVFILVLRGAVEAYYQVEHTLESDDQNLRYYQESLLQECNMIAVAAAIVSSVTITTYQFPGVSSMHWTVSAAFTFSLIASLFCVYGACTLQRRISNISTSSQFRAWLQAPNTKAKSLSNGLGPVPSTQRANVATVLTLTAPKTLLDHSIRFFLLGLIGYLICLHAFATRGDFSANNPVLLSTAGSTSTGSRNVIIVSAFALCVGISLLIAPSSYRNFNLIISDPLVDKIVQNMQGQQPPCHSRPDVEIADQYFRYTGAKDVGNSEKSDLNDRLCQALVHAAAAYDRSSNAAKECAEANRAVADAYMALLHSQ